MSRLFASASSQGLEITSALITAYPLTMFCWYNPTTSAATGSAISISATANATNYWALGVTSAAKPFASARTGAGSENDAIHGTSVTNGTWGALCGVFTSITSRDIYFNALSPVNNSTSTAAPVSPAVTNIGNLNLSTGRTSFANAAIAYATIWNVALRLDEIQRLAQGHSPLTIRPVSLVSFAPLAGMANPEQDTFQASGWTFVGSPTQGPTNPPVTTIPIPRNLKPHIFSPGNAK